MGAKRNPPGGRPPGAYARAAELKKYVALTQAENLEMKLLAIVSDEKIPEPVRMEALGLCIGWFYLRIRRDTTASAAKLLEIAQQG